MDIARRLLKAQKQVTRWLFSEEPKRDGSNLEDWRGSSGCWSRTVATVVTLDGVIRQSGD
jgi:hypothetical protein